MVQDTTKYMLEKQTTNFCNEKAHTTNFCNEKAHTTNFCDDKKRTLQTFVMKMSIRSRVQFLILYFFIYYIITTTVTNWTPGAWKFLLDSYWTPTGLLLDSLYWTPLYPFLRNPQFLVIPVGIY